MALRADGPQHQYRFTLDDQQGSAISRTTLINENINDIKYIIDHISKEQIMNHGDGSADPL
jgi:hypothetical protein